jgi:hypothetical protein
MPVLRGTVLAVINGVGWEDNLMKRAFLIVMLLCLFVLGANDAQAQGYYNPYWGGTPFYPQQYYPYAELDALHYRLNLPQFQTYPIYPCPPYPIYPYVYPYPPYPTYSYRPYSIYPGY